MSGSATNVIQAPKMEPRIMRYELSVAMERGLLQRGAMPRFSLNDDGIVVRAQQKLLKRINVIWVVQSLLQKYFASPVGQIISTNSRHPTPQGAYHDRHERGVGCGGRGSVLRATGLQGESKDS